MSVQRWYVICKNCEVGIELEVHEPIGGNKVEWSNPQRREKLKCRCGETHEYRGSDFQLKEAED